MDLVDLLDEYGLQQDEWSLTTPRFGNEGQLQVIGWSGKRKNRSDKFYILTCNRCSQDNDLFGDGYFKSSKCHLINGKVPCGCARGTRWSQDQFNVLCSRKAKELGYTFLGFEGEWRGINTKIKMLCEKHGEWNTGTIDPLVNRCYGCPSCAHDIIREAKKKPDEVMISCFMTTGGFHVDTKFWRSERVDNRGSKVYWFMDCPECGTSGESNASCLRQGSRSCVCSKHRQQEAYVNLIVDGSGVAVALKFGIANSSEQRIKSQHAKSNYTVIQHSVFTFPTAQQCKKAESECLQELECGVVLKSDMRDGYTETTWVYNLEKIVEIYEQNGGLLSERV